MAEMIGIKSSALERFREINRAFPKTKEILEAKARGQKIFGWLCTYVPEEVIMAAGGLPIRITGYNQEMELEDGNAYLYINNCSFSKSCLQLGLGRRPRGHEGLVDGIQDFCSNVFSSHKIICFRL